MRDSTKRLYNYISMNHKLMHQEIENWSKEEKDNYSAFELADSSYALREMIAFMEDTVKQLKKQENMAHAKCGVIYVTSTAEGPIKTPYCQATVHVKQIPEIPKLHKNPEEYQTFMSYLGIPQDLIDADMIRLQWNSFMDWYNTRIAQGYPTPKGIDVSKTVSTASLRIRKKKEIEFIPREKG